MVGESHNNNSSSSDATAAGFCRYAPTNTQADVFEDTEAIMTSCVDGYNVCLIAYGQTGSGKTYTMMGTDDNPGVGLPCHVCATPCHCH